MPPAAFFSVQSLKDPALPGILTSAQAAGVELLLTDGLLGRLPPALSRSLTSAPRVHVLNISANPKGLLANPPTGLADTRDALLGRIGLRLSAPPAWVALYPYQTGEWALMNLADQPMDYALTHSGSGQSWNGTIAARGWARGKPQNT